MFNNKVIKAPTPEIYAANLVMSVTLYQTDKFWYIPRQKLAIKIIGTIYMACQYSGSPIKINFKTSRATTTKTSIEDPIMTNVSRTKA